MVLGKLPVPGRPTIWIIVGQGPIALAVGAGGGCLDFFTLIYPFSPLSPSLWETARYRLKYCLKGPLNPKQPTNQPTAFSFRFFKKGSCQLLAKVCAQSTGKPLRSSNSRKENPQKLTQLSSRSHPRHLVGKRTAQKDITIDTTSDSQVNSNFPDRWSPASLTFNNYFYLFLYLYIT